MDVPHGSDYFLPILMALYLLLQQKERGFSASRDIKLIGSIIHIFSLHALSAKSPSVYSSISIVSSAMWRPPTSSVIEIDMDDNSLGNIREWSLEAY